MKEKFSKSYNNLFDANSKEFFKLSRSKIDLFIECPRCFYLDRRLGVTRPSFPPFTLNSAVDALLKKEFDIHRAKGNIHPLMKTYGIDAIPLDHKEIDQWRNSLGGGIGYLHPETNFKIYGGIDDVWVNPEGEYIIVDYKATSKSGEITLDDKWKDSYKRQMEIYQWLFRKNNFKVSRTGYFVFCNASRDREAFDGKLEFEVTILPYKGDDSWVEPTVLKIYECLKNDEIPKASENCEYCSYRKSVVEKAKKFLKR